MQSAQEILNCVLFHNEVVYEHFILAPDSKETDATIILDQIAIKVREIP